MAAHRDRLDSRLDAPLTPQQWQIMGQAYADMADGFPAYTREYCEAQAERCYRKADAG